LTTEARRSEGRRILAGLALRAPIALIIGALAIPASSLAETVSLKAGASEVLMETVTITCQFNRIKATFDGTVVADRTISSGDTLDIETGDRENRVILNQAEDVLPEVETLVDMGAGADSFVSSVRGDSNALEVHMGSGNDLYGNNNFGDGDQIRVDGDAGDDIVSLQIRGKDNTFRVNGGAGDDYAKVNSPSNLSGNSIRADLGAGDDVLQSKGGITAVYDGGAGHDRLSISGNGAQYQLVGGTGDDELTTRGTGRDTVSGGRGNDLIVVRGGGRDTVKCGAGRDTVLADKNDVVADDCESLKAI
jgi:Ca2+-binding RTX toxin-like protein